MALYRMNEAAFELPGEARDRTVHRLRVDGGVRLSVTRAAAPPGQTLDEVVAENAEATALYLRDHRVLSRTRAEVAGHDAVEITATWRGKDGAVYTRQAHVRLEGGWLALAANAPAEERQACDAAFDRALSTLELRGD